MSFIKKYILLHIKYLDIFYEYLFLKTNGIVFTSLFNFRSILKRKEVRVRYDKSKKQYCAYEKDKELSFFHTKQSNMAYKEGFYHRAITLADSYAINLIDFNQGDFIVDCGANIGDLKLYFDYLGLDVEYLGIEPSPEEYECLKSNISPSKAKNLGLWDSKSQMEFYVSSQGADSSLIKPKNYDKTLIVDVVKLDDLEEVKNKNIKLLKLEAEGAEPEVLLGCDETLNNISYIAADLSFERGVKEESTLEEVTNFLLKREFELIKVSPRRFSALFKSITHSKI